MANQIEILVVEDEFINRLHLKKSLHGLGYLNVYEASNAEEAIEILKTNKIRLAILDINLDNNEKDGVWLANYINTNHQMPFIFLTAYFTNEIRGRAIKSLPFAYLIKPFNSPELMAAVELAIHKFENNEEGQDHSNLVIKESNHFVKIDTREILYVESIGNYIHIHTRENVHRHRSTIKSILAQLPSEKFVQTHRGFVANLLKIEKFNSTYVVINGTKIPLSRKYSDQVELNG